MLLTSCVCLAQICPKHASSVALLRAPIASLTAATRYYRPLQYHAQQMQ